MILTAEEEARRDHDIDVAQRVAIKAEEAACLLMATMIDVECENPIQKSIASAVLTAAMITKFKLAHIAVPSPEWGVAVDRLVSQMTPEAEQVALDVRLGQSE